MGVNLGDPFEAEVANLAGLTNYDSGSLDIPFVNPNGDTTVRFTVSKNVDTPTLKALITEQVS